MRPCAIVPSHDHWHLIGEIVQRLHAAGLPVFVIDDGSGEPARAAIAGLHNVAAGIVVLRLEPNRGKGGAVIAGLRMAAASGFSHAMQVDADGQHDLSALPRLLALSARYPEALISGQPIYDDSVPMARRMGRWLTHVWVWVETLSFRIADSMCGFRVYPLTPVIALLDRQKVGQRMDFDTEIMVRLFWQGTPIVSVPVGVVYPPGNVSNFQLFGDNWRITKMHTRLVFAMLWHIRSILLKRPPRVTLTSDAQAS